LIKKFAVSLVLFLMWVGLIFVLSGIQNASLDFEVPGITVNSFFKHFIEYAILGALTFNLFRQVFKNRNRAIIYSVIFPFIYGVSDEIHQYFVPTRISDYPDVIVDTIGGLAGVLFLLLIFYLIRKRKENFSSHV
jgi:LPXTG-motif cell wall-anchored protein